MSKLMERSNKHLMAAIEKWERFADEDMKLANDFAFASCGCEVAYPSWWALPDGTNEIVDCVHLGCQIRRGEYKRPGWAVRLNAQFRGELEGGWLRFNKESAKGRRAAAALYWAMKKEQEFDIMAAVWTGILTTI